MRIYIDESGAFIPEASPNHVCCEAALVVPERIAPELLTKYEQLRAQWTSATEVKGSSLSDEQTAAALEILGRYDVMIEIVGLDVAHNSRKQIEEFRRDQSQAILNGLTPEHNAAAREWAHGLREEWQRLSLQLIVQMYVLILTIEEVIRSAPNYYAQRMPDELARFDWILDPKDINPTPFELLWEKIVCPVLQTRSLDEPWWRIKEFDYSAFSRFDRETPDYIRPHVRRVGVGGDGCVNLGMLMRESVAFPNSKDNPGLQLVDIIANAFARAMNGKLPPAVWRLLGPLMVEKPGGVPTAQLVALGEGPRIKVGKYHTYVLTALRNRAKKFFVTTSGAG